MIIEMTTFAAIDLGAESGRVVCGSIRDGRLRLEETARFPNGMVRMAGGLHWNIPGLYQGILDGLRRTADTPPSSVGVDSWGVDFALLARDGSLLGLPVCYRDPRTDGLMERVFKRVPRETIYRKTGIQFMQINTLYQLASMGLKRSPLLHAAAHLLLIPDLFHYLLTSEKCGEFTNATTTQCFNANENCWDAALLEAVDVDPAIMPPVSPPGTVVGELNKDAREDTGLGAVRVVAPATHDTGSAIAAVPAQGGDWAYISSGTWSLMGVENNAPVTSAEALDGNFTNEGGAGGTFRFLKNIMGLWLVQRCRAGFDKRYEYHELTRLAGEAPAFAALVNVNAARFLNPPDMPAAIRDFCNHTGQAPPDTPGAFVRCALESLALEYRAVLHELSRVLNRNTGCIHVIGGGARNEMLCQMTADATGLPVLAGPVEATAAGNVLVQAMAMGYVESLEHARAIVRKSFPIKEYEPRDTAPWDQAWERYKTLRSFQ